MRLSEIEIRAVQAALKEVGAYVGTVGMAKGLEAYSKDEALKLVATAYTAVRNAIELDDECEF